MVIDDKLPTIDGRLIFVHSKNPNEFWPALLEKAYAKYVKCKHKWVLSYLWSINNTITTCARVCGSYTDMNVGTPVEAMMDFTGGVHMSIQLSDPPQNLWELMYRAGKSHTLMSCGTLQGVRTHIPLKTNIDWFFFNFFYKVHTDYFNSLFGEFGVKSWVSFGGFCPLQT